MARDDLVLIGMASDGSVEQWDGLTPPAGIMLRWFQHPRLGFPQYGYELYRADVSDVSTTELNWRELAPSMRGQSRVALEDGMVLESTRAFGFMELERFGPVPLVAANERIFITFPKPVWYLRITAALSVGAGVTVTVFAGGIERETRAVPSNGQAEEWHTRGIDRLEITGDGAILRLGVQASDAPRNWRHLTRITLPVSDPRYPAHPDFRQSDADEARHRVPSGVDWARRYAAGFRDLYPYLVQIATGGDLAPLPPSRQAGAPRLAMDPMSAIRLATLDPHIARVVGLAWDDPLAPYGLDGRIWAYMVIGRWRGPTLWELWLDGRDGWEPLDALREQGAELILSDGQDAPSPDGLELVLPSGAVAELNPGSDVDGVTFSLRSDQPLGWRARSGDGTEIDGDIPASAGDIRTIAIDASEVWTIELRADGEVELLDRERLLEQGVTVEVDNGDLEERDDRWLASLQPDGVLRLLFEPPADARSIRLGGTRAVQWTAWDPNERELGAGVTPVAGLAALMAAGEGAQALVLTMQSDSVLVLPDAQRFEELGVSVSWDSGEDEWHERGWFTLRLPEGAKLEIWWPEPAERVWLQLGGLFSLSWQALDRDGSVLEEGELKHEGDTTVAPDGWRELRIELLGLEAIELIATTDPATTVTVRHISAMRAHAISALLPAIRAEDPGPATGPSWIAADVSQPSVAGEPLEAGLSWDLARNVVGPIAEHGIVFYQIAGKTLTTDIVSSKPTPPPFSRSMLLKNGALITVPESAATRSHPRFALDRPVTEGWRCWWARGVDLFGRATAPSPPDTKLIADLRTPPPPVLVNAEYIQADLPAAAAGVLSRSPLARSWVASRPKQDAVVVTWAWTPELDASCPDVDSFRIFARRPQASGGGNPAAAAITFDDHAWSPVPTGTTGAIPVRFDGAVSRTVAGIASVTVTAVQAVDATSVLGTTDLTLDTGAGALIGARLVGATGSYEVVGNGDGANAMLILSHPQGKPPAPGTYRLDPGSAEIVTIVTTLAPPPLGTDPFRRRLAGVLASGTIRMAVLGQSGGTFICKRLPLPDGTASPLPHARWRISWYPAYAFAIANHPRANGFGPRPSLTTPVAHAQVCVTATRRSATRPVESEKSSPGGIAAVDTTPPPVPQLPAIAAGARCAQLATRADWHGISRFTLTWPAQAPWQYTVYRALSDAVFQLDRKAHIGKTHSFPVAAWPTGVWNDSVRRSLVLSDLATLDAAIATGDDATIRSAYDGLRAETQQLIAGQEAVRAAYVPPHGEPLTASQVPWTDTFDGRSRGHWFYRVASRSPSGIESAWSAPTPPICAPDAVAPEAPVAQLALAAEGGVRLRWLRSPEADLDHYRIYRAADMLGAADIRTMSEVAVLVGDPTAEAEEDKPVPMLVAGQKGVLEHVDPAPAGREWLYRVVAIDTAGNASRPSGVLRGRALAPPPEPPKWNDPVRTGTTIRLSWKHADDRLACLVERRQPGGSLWVSVSGWLPRGEYQFEDTPHDPAAAWEYRLRVRDVSGTTAPSQPVMILPERP